MPTQREFEVCAETLQACEAASTGGADRIEVCAALSEGGVTPGPGFLREVLAVAKIPVHVLVRPRSGDFCYTPAEFRMMCADAEMALELGASGIVAGMLMQDGKIDAENTATLVRLAAGRCFTFHRAFDLSRDLRESLRIVMDLGCSRVLTSGGQPSVMEGLDVLRSLAQLAAGRLQVAAGGGVTLANAPQLVRIPGLDLHGSLRKKATAVEAGGDVLWAHPDTRVAVEDVRAMAALVHARL